MKEELYKKQNSEPSNPPMSPFEIIGQQMDMIRRSLSGVDEQIDILDEDKNSETDQEDNYDKLEIEEKEARERERREPTDFPGRGNYED